MSHGHYLRSAQWDSLADAAARDGLWFWNELLAPTTRLAGTWHLAVARFRFAGLAGALRTNRLVTGHRGRKFDPDSFWGRQRGPNPTDRAKLGSERHLICDGRGVPLAIQLTGANRNDSQQALALVDAIPALQGKHGRPRRRPTACWVTAVTMPKRSGNICVTEASSLFSRCATQNMVVDWGDGAGSWKGPSLG